MEWVGGGRRTWWIPFSTEPEGEPRPERALLAAPPPQLTVLTFCFAVGVHPFGACWGLP